MVGLNEMVPVDVVAEDDFSMSLTCPLGDMILLILSYTSTRVDNKSEKINSLQVSKSPSPGSNRVIHQSEDRHLGFLDHCQFDLTCNGSNFV